MTNKRLVKTMWCYGKPSKYNCLFLIFSLFFRSLPNGVYMLLNTSLQQYPAYCHMNGIDGCGAGPWTLAMTLDGTKVFLLSLHFVIATQM